MIYDFLNYEFWQNAFINCFFASIVCGIIGVIIVEKKLVMMSGGIAHTAYGGVGLGYLLGMKEPIMGAFGFAIAAAFGIGAVNKKGSSDIAIALFWSLGMALGIMFIAMMPGYPPDITTYLFGNILTVTRSNIKMMAGVTVLVILITLVFYNDWKAYLFDSEFSRIMGLKVKIYKYILLVMISVSIVALIKVAGIILVLALLTAPAATAGLFSKKLASRMVLASLFGMFFCLCGLILSYYMDKGSGATIIIFSVVFYFAACLFKKMINKRKRVI